MALRPTAVRLLARALHPSSSPSSRVSARSMSGKAGTAGGLPVEVRRM